MDSEIVIIDGMMLSAEHVRINEIIQDYDPTLSLVWIPPNMRSHDDREPFAVRCDPPDAPAYIVFRLAENAVDHRVLARLFAGDNAKNSDILTVIENEEAARRLLDMKKEMDRQEEAKELAAWAIKARPGSKHNGVRFD